MSWCVLARNASQSKDVSAWAWTWDTRPGLGSRIVKGRESADELHGQHRCFFLQNGPLNNLEHILPSVFLRDAMMHFHQSGWAPPKMTSAVHRAAGFQVPSASQSENARLVFCTLGAPWINASKNTWGCSFASCNKKTTYATDVS